MKYKSYSAQFLYFWYLPVLAFLISNPIFGQQSHLLNFKLNKTVSSDWIEIYSNTNNYNMIYEADFSTLSTSKKVRLHKVSKYDKFEMEVVIQADPANVLEFGISQQNSLLYPYKFIINGTDFYTSVPGYTTIAQPYSGTSVFKYSKCRDELKMFYNNVLIGTYLLTNNGNINYETFFTPTTAPSIDISVVHTLGGQCLPYDPLARFSILNTEIPTTLTAVSQNILRFYYFEKYNVVTNVNDQVTWELFDQNHNLVLSGYLSNNFGSNYKTVDLISIPSIDNHLLVVKGPNKNSTYYLKLKNVN